MGHKDIQMVMRVYGKWLEQGKEKRHHYVSEFGNYGASMEHQAIVNEETGNQLKYLPVNQGKVQVLSSAPVISIMLSMILTQR
jgi:hypothetical protein